MGWTGMRASFYKTNGTINRKKECDNLLKEQLEKKYVLIESQMVGTTYYSAIRNIETNVISATIILTMSNLREYDNFQYKVIDENMGPVEAKCPQRIIQLLTPTDDEITNKWRKKCREYNEKPKLSNLPIGTVIEFITGNGETRRLVKRAPAYQFKNSWWQVEGKDIYYSKKYIPSNFKIISDFSSQIA